MKRNLKTTVSFIALLLSIYPCTTIAQTQVGNDIYGMPSDQIGFSVDINGNGNRIAVASYVEDDLNGATRIYDIVGDTWVPVGNPILGTNQEASGIEVSFSDSGERVAIGSLYYDLGNLSGAGRVKIYDYDGNDWVQVGEDIIQVQEWNRFGRDIKLSADGSRVAIGADQYSVPLAQYGKGFMAVYELENNSWEQIGENIEGLLEGDGFGIRLDFTDDGNTVVGLSIFSGGTGEARVFQLDNTESWTQVGQSIIGSPSQGITRLSISSDGTRLGASSPALDIVTMYDYNTNTSSWEQIGANIQEDFTAFGSSISIVDGNKDLILIGSDVGEATDNGFVGDLRLYKYENETWSQLGGTVHGIESEAHFGAASGVSNDGNTVIGGAPFNDGGTGDFTDDRGLVRVFTDIFETLGIGEESVLNNLVIYPNPASDHFKINGLENEQNYNIEIVNINGQLVKKYARVSNNMSLDISNLQNGVYFLKASNSENSFTKKLVISSY